MKKKLLQAILAFFIITIAVSSIFTFGGCTKETVKTIHDTLTVYKKDTLYKVDTVDFDNVCPIRGLYVGTNVQSTGATSNSIYTFYDNHFAIGQETLTGPNTSWAGFRNTCDSVIMSLYYSQNGKYYLLKGKLSNNRRTISGTYTATDGSSYGTFSMTK